MRFKLAQSNEALRELESKTSRMLVTSPSIDLYAEFYTSEMFTS